MGHRNWVHKHNVVNMFGKAGILCLAALPRKTDLVCLAGVQELVRSCLTAVPHRQNGLLHVKVLSEESVWAEGVL